MTKTSLKGNPDARSCPQCETLNLPQSKGGYFRCGKCGGLYDSEPEEGSASFYNDPTKRIELEEERERKAVRRG